MKSISRICGARIIIYDHKCSKEKWTSHWSDHTFRVDSDKSDVAGRRRVTSARVCGSCNLRSRGCTAHWSRVTTRPINSEW